jgi:hypothetical protein
VLQLYVVPPAPVKVALAPAQMVGELTVTVGDGFTVTEETAVFVQPPVVPETVYVVDTTGETLIGFVLAPVLQL